MCAKKHPVPTDLKSCRDATRFFLFNKSCLPTVLSSFGSAACVQAADQDGCIFVGVPERFVKVGICCSDTEVWLNLIAEKFKMIIGVLFVVGKHYNHYNKETCKVNKDESD